MVLYSDILIGLPMEMKLCHMLVGKYLVSPGGAHGQHHAGGVRGAAVRDDTSPQPDFCLINWHLVIQ